MPNQVTAYCRWLLGRVEPGLAALRPAARVGGRVRLDVERRDPVEPVGARRSPGVAGEPAFAGGSSSGVNELRSSGARTRPVTVASPSGWLCGREAGSRSSVGTKPRLTITTAPSASRGA